MQSSQRTVIFICGGGIIYNDLKKMEGQKMDFVKHKYNRIWQTFLPFTTVFKGFHHSSNYPLHNSTLTSSFLSRICSVANYLHVWCMCLIFFSLCLPIALVTMWTPPLIDVFSQVCVFLFPIMGFRHSATLCLPDKHRGPDQQTMAGNVLWVTDGPVGHLKLPCVSLAQIFSQEAVSCVQS